MLTIDLAPDGTICGIDPLNTNKQLQRNGQGGLLSIDEGTDERVEVPLATSPPRV